MRRGWAGRALRSSARWRLLAGISSRLLAAREPDAQPPHSLMTVRTWPSAPGGAGCACVLGWAGPGPGPPPPVPAGRRRERVADSRMGDGRVADSRMGVDRVADSRTGFLSFH